MIYELATFFLSTHQKMTQRLTGNTKPSTRKRLRNVCFTLNNPKGTRCAFIDQLVATNKISYIVVGSEEGESGTPHFQGYVEFVGQETFAWIHDLLQHAHIEPRKGTPEEAQRYCMKDNNWTEWGTLSRPGTRSDIGQVAADIAAGVNLSKIARDYPCQFIKFNKGFLALKSALIVKRSEKPEVRVYYGTTGTGKSFRAREWLPDGYVWHPQQGQWFDGYQGDTEVVFEEFRGQIPFGMMLSLLDRYDCKVQYKGGVSEFCATKIALTSPVHPREWYLNNENDRVDQLIRRITKVTLCEYEEELPPHIILAE